MPILETEIQDIQFLLLDVLKAPAVLRTLPRYADLDEELVRQVVDEEERFVCGILEPMAAAAGDTNCSLSASGRVQLPQGYAEAYNAFVDAGWPSLACEPEDGGQGLPKVLNSILYELLSGASLSWAMGPGLLHGAYECIRHYATPVLKTTYLEKLCSGEWLSSMCLTEAQAGSDLGLIRTQAKLEADGVFRISGTKIFISYGEHDLTPNIVHLVLAREPNAPLGSKGLSLFLSPKYRDKGVRNQIYCERLEEKMGLHGSPTCVMRFDNAIGWRIGEPGKGLQAMFIMMNAARLHVAMQGIGLLSAAWQRAFSYARERHQMRAPGVRCEARRGSDPIIKHPAIKNLLDVERVWIDALRLLAYRTAVELDVAEHHQSNGRKQVAQTWCRLATPILKTICTDQAFKGASNCLQVFGGHGYVKEWGIEQIVRDARITPIYEGTNEIQAIDLLIRAVLPDQGEALWGMFSNLAEELVDGSESRKETEYRFGVVRELVRLIAQVGDSNPELPFRVADTFLRACALAMVGWACAVIANSARQARWESVGSVAKERILPEFDTCVEIIHHSCSNVLLS